MNYTLTSFAGEDFSTPTTTPVKFHTAAEAEAVRENSLEAIRAFWKKDPNVLRVRITYHGVLAADGFDAARCEADLANGSVRKSSWIRIAKN